MKTRSASEKRINEKPTARAKDGEENLSDAALAPRFCASRSRVSALVFLFLAAFLMAARGYSAPQKIRWVSFKSTLLKLQVSVPDEWKPVKIPRALAFRYEDLSGETAGFGILRSGQNGKTIEQTADEEIAHEGHPADWVLSRAKVDGMPAIKITGSDVKNPGQKLVHYYVDTPQGIYLLQCQSSQEYWSKFSPIFAAILTQLRFLN